MAHGDNDGLRVPPRLAPIQVIVVAIKGEVIDATEEIARDIQGVGVRAQTDTRTNIPYGRRAVDWELKGVPLRIELGPRDMVTGSVSVVRRIPRLKTIVAFSELTGEIKRLLEADHADMLNDARADRDARISDVSTVAEAVDATVSGWARIPWSVITTEDEDRLGRSSRSVRCLQRQDGSVPEDENEEGLLAYIARAY